MKQKLKELHGRKFVRDALVLQAATFVQGGSYLITSVLTKRYLGMEQMGRWNTAREIFMFAYFLVSMGVVNAAVSRYSEAVGRKDRQASVNALASMLKIGLVSSVLVITLGFLFGPAVAQHFYDDAEVGHWSALLCVAGLFEVVRGLTVVALQGTRQMREFAWFDISTNMLRLVLVFLALQSGWGVCGVVWAFLVHMAMAGAVALHYYRRARRGDPRLAPPPLREVFAAVPGSSVGQVFGLSYLLALNKSMNTLVPRFGMLLIPALATLQDAGKAFHANAAYSIAYVLSWGLGLAMGGVTQALLPALGLRIANTDTPFDQMGGLLKRVSLIAGSIMVGATLLSIPVMYVVIHAFYGAGAEDSFTYYLCLTSGNLFIGFTCVVEAFYIYSGKLRQAVPFNFLLAALMLAGIVLGGHWFGPIGVAAAAGLGRAVGLFHLVYMAAYFRRARLRRPVPPGPTAVS
ncbi:MAG TPA: lipopolysaccharide biosynthesis protein [Planctomycetota bacterium]|nr:lipopolysaccharide biosynthesis protein [Planctomycetota bacterium]